MKAFGIRKKSKAGGSASKTAAAPSPASPPRPTVSPAPALSTTTPSQPTVIETAPAPPELPQSPNDSNQNNKSKIIVNIDSNALDQALAATPPSSFIGAIDQGTSSSRFVIVSQHSGRIVASAQLEIRQYYPETGWHEQDPRELYESVVQCVDAVFKVLPVTLTLQAIGITNQRETTIAWNKETGLPYYNAIVWDDLRTTDIAREIRRRVAVDDLIMEQSNPTSCPSATNSITQQTGLPLASYFAGTKVRWLVENVPQLAKDLQERPEQVCFGTVDVWLAYQLTGTEVLAKDGIELSNPSSITVLHKGGLFVTDATNASRWLFMDLTSQTWNEQLIDTVMANSSAKVPLSALPSIHSSSHVFGSCSDLESIPKLLRKVPLAAILGDQQAALFGQTCFLPGEAKVCYTFVENETH
jgi:glycerol kinase